MSDPVQVEAIVEAAVVAAIVAKLPAGSTAKVVGWWQSGGNADAAKTAEPPVVLVTAAPNVPYGYRSACRKVPVQVTCVTNPGDDLNGATVRGLYNAVREVFDANALTCGTGVTYRGHEVLDPGFPGMDERGWHVSLLANYEVTVG